MSTGAEQPIKSSVEGAIRWAVGGSNRRTNSFVMYGSSAPVPGGMRSTAITCERCAVPNITAHSIRCLCAISSDYGKCHIPPDLVVECGTDHRKPPEVRI